MTSGPYGRRAGRRTPRQPRPDPRQHRPQSLALRFPRWRHDSLSSITHVPLPYSQPSRPRGSYPAKKSTLNADFASLRLRILPPFDFPLTMRIGRRPATFNPPQDAECIPPPNPGSCTGLYIAIDRLQLGQSGTHRTSDRHRQRTEGSCSYSSISLSRP